MPIVLISGSLKLLEPPGPVLAYIGIVIEFIIIFGFRTKLFRSVYELCVNSELASRFSAFIGVIMYDDECQIKL